MISSPYSAAAATSGARSSGGAAGGGDRRRPGRLAHQAHEALAAAGLRDQQEPRLRRADGEGVGNIARLVYERAGRRLDHLAADQKVSVPSIT
jgi:hypothetical protein